STAASSTTIRTFTQNSPSFSNGRPQLPFLTTPAAFHRQQQWRYLTTERKQWLRREIRLGVRYAIYGWAIAFLVICGGWTLHQEKLEHQHPTPPEWSYISRMLKRDAEVNLVRTDTPLTPWATIVQLLRHVIVRLEDPDGDGKGLRDLGSDKPPGAKDITAMSEAWRRGYYEALLLCCKAAEHVEGWVVDKTRATVFPPDVVRGPSNPFPKPIVPGSKPPPKEADCEPADFPKPDALYLKLIATEGLTTKQRMDAIISYATWLEFKGALEPAAVMYEDALNLAIEEIYTPGAPFLLDPKTGALINDENPERRKPSANLLHSLTALATFKARHDDASAALPILITILQARRSLPAPTAISRAESSSNNRSALRKAIDFITPPPYPAPPPDGTAPPVRDSKELCEEAALHLHIGEILYTMQSSTREEGIAWTREGVDLAEEELHKVVDSRRTNKAALAAGKMCRDCLGSGLENWSVMVKRMVQEEEARANKDALAATASKTSSGAGWFNLWSGSKTAEQETGGRWAAEGKVVAERTKRAQDILENL
ncbi:hypothetical protein BD289DRAFT_354350, partial [Coniella lustricola]